MPAWKDMRLPVSVEGVLIRRGRVLVLRNDRGEWELPGGRLDDGESPEEALVREIREETGLAVAVGRPVDAWVFQVTPTEKVLVLEVPVSISIRTPEQERALQAVDFVSWAVFRKYESGDSTYYELEARTQNFTGVGVKRCPVPSRRGCCTSE